MAGGHWAKGQNPYFNYDFDAAEQHQRSLNSESEAKREKSNADAANADASRLRRRSVQASAETGVLKRQLGETKGAVYKLAIRANIMQRTLNDLIAKHPGLAEEILDTIQINRTFCNQPEYQDKWWDYLNSLDYSKEIDYLNFPYEKREINKG